MKTYEKLVLNFEVLFTENNICINMNKKHTKIALKFKNSQNIILKTITYLENVN